MCRGEGRGGGTARLEVYKKKWFMLPVGFGDVHTYLRTDESFYFIWDILINSMYISLRNVLWPCLDNEQPHVGSWPLKAQTLCRLTSSLSWPKSCTRTHSKYYSQLPCTSYACVRGNNSPYQQAAVVCISHSKREIGRPRTADIQAVVMIRTWNKAATFTPLSLTT